MKIKTFDKIGDTITGTVISSYIDDSISVAKTRLVIMQEHGTNLLYEVFAPGRYAETIASLENKGVITVTLKSFEETILGPMKVLDITLHQEHMTEPQLDKNTATAIKNRLQKHLERVSEMYYSKPPFVLYDPHGITQDEKDSAYWRQGIADCINLIEREFINVPNK